MQTKNIPHFEDLILTGDLSILDFFNGDYEVSLKVDGSPCVFWGFDNDGKFFVSLKSIFNKIKKKICYTVDDIQFHYSEQPKLANILTLCLEYLPREEGIFSGDFIGFGGSEEYQPNTISYQFPEVITQTLIISPHTSWKTDGELKDVYVTGSAPFFADTDDVKFVQPCVDSIRPQLPYINTDNIQFLTESQAKEAKKQLNQLLREGSDFEWWEIAEIFECRNLAHLYLTMIELKEQIMEMMVVTDSPAAYLNGERIIGEGFVCKNDEMIFKLVDRFSFSRSNFLTPKNW